MKQAVRNYLMLLAGLIIFYFVLRTYFVKPKEGYEDMQNNTVDFCAKSPGSKNCECARDQDCQRGMFCEPTDATGISSMKVCRTPYR